jgi:hypothetical protein
MRPLCALVRTRRCDSRVRQWFGHRLVPLQALVRVRVSMTVCERVSTSIYMCVRSCVFELANEDGSACSDGAPA